MTRQRQKQLDLMKSLFTVGLCRWDWRQDCNKTVTTKYQIKPEKKKKIKKPFQSLQPASSGGRQSTLRKAENRGKKRLLGSSEKWQVWIFMDFKQGFEPNPLTTEPQANNNISQHYFKLTGDWTNNSQPQQKFNRDDKTDVQTTTIPLLAFRPSFLSHRQLSAAPAPPFHRRDWLGWMVVRATGSQYVARMKQRVPEKEQPTLIAMATLLLRGPQRLVLPETLVLAFDWSQSSLSSALLLSTRPLYASSSCPHPHPHPSSSSSSPSLSDLVRRRPTDECVFDCVVTCVWTSVISLTRKAEFPSSLWHVTVKFP